MSSELHLMTAEELMALPRDGQRYELVQGIPRMMSPAGGRHGRITLKLARRLGDFVEAHGLGVTYAAETGFLLEQDPDTVRAPDVAFVSTARLGPYQDHAGFLPLAPNLVAEVVSPGDAKAEVERKVGDWLAAGVTVVLVVDPQSRTVREYRSQTASRDYTDGHVDLNDVVPGFRLDVAELFA